MRHQATSQVRPICAAMCLLSYLLSTTPLLPIGTALIAWVDGEHRVTLSSDKDSTRVVLGHDARDPRKALTHSHCALSRLLTLMAEPSGPSHADHVLNFQCGISTTLREATPWAAAPYSQSEARPAPVFVAAAVPPGPVINIEAPLLDIPPPAISVVVARAIIFLI